MNVSETINRIPKRKRSGAKRFRGICSDAETLGVNRIHLWKVLVGVRESKPLLARYKALKREQKLQEAA